MTEENKIRDAADAIKGIVESVPVYQDVVQPAAKEVGTALQTVAKTLHILLAPISALVWGYDKIKDFVGESVAKKLENVPTEELQSPEPHLAGPALEALRYTGYQEELREMYAKLLASSIDKKTAINAHPAFVEIIKQLSPDEARLLKHLSYNQTIPFIDVRQEETNSNVGRWVLRFFSLAPYISGCVNPDLGANYLINLQRLGLLELRENYSLRDQNKSNNVLPAYQELKEHHEVKLLQESVKAFIGQRITFAEGAIIVTKLGEQFCFACINANTHARHG